MAAKTDRPTAAKAAGTSAPVLWPKLIFIVAIAVAAVMGAFPLDEEITLGLDLQGGTHMVLQVDLDEAVGARVERDSEGVRTQLEDEEVSFRSVERATGGRIVVSGIASGDQATAEEALEIFENEWDVDFEGSSATLTLKREAEERIREDSARQVKETIRRRIDAFGVAEPQVTLSGDEGDRIVLQLPGLDEVERVKDIITRASVLEFRLGLASGATEEEVLQALGGELPVDAEILAGAEGGRTEGQLYALRRVAVVRGEDLVDARSQTDEFGRPAIGFSLSREGGRTFGEFTGDHVGQPLAVVLDDKVVQHANIEDQIFSQGIIRGGYSVQEAQDAALTLRSGALPAKVSILFEQTVGPSLGRESIAAGFAAAQLGLLLVMLFMLAWYLLAGVNAVVALGLNIVLVLALLSWLDATLTLPGIAGLILTIGMAVDANVIIFERIKEEHALGKSARASIDGGFDKAFSAIFDANVTTLLAAFFLYNFGTGPIKGFAITLSLGILASMFTAIFVSRALFELRLTIRSPKKLRMGWRERQVASVPFMKARHVAFAISGVVLVAAIATWTARGLNYGIDFAGGTQVIVKAEEGLTADDLRERLAGTPFANVPVQGFGDPDEHEFIVRVGEAEAAVETATVNAPEGAADVREGAASRLIALLSPPGDAIDVNAVGRATITDTLRDSGGFPAAAAEQAARRIVEARTDRGGLFADVQDVASVEGVPAEIGAWLAASTVAGDFTAISTESVGPAIGEELKSQARSAVIWSILAILLYISVRFELRFGVAAVAALTHDVLITVGVLAVAGVEFNISIIAALLTIVGYSLNDTIVVFDRVRENLHVLKDDRLLTVLDTSLNQTLSRSLLTSGTTLLVVVALLIFGGPVLAGFAFTLLVGVLVGTYSSVFVASPILHVWEHGRLRRAARREATAEV